MDIDFGIIQTVVGTGEGGYSGDGGPAILAMIGEAYGIALDAEDNLFISDGRTHTVRRVDSITSVITTVVGTGVEGYSGDGRLATRASLNNLYSLQVDTNGDIYVVDRMNAAIRKADAATGIITTVAGTGVPGYGGDGGPGVKALSFGNPTTAIWTGRVVCSLPISRTIVSAAWTSKLESLPPSPEMGRGEGPETAVSQQRRQSWAPEQCA